MTTQTTKTGGGVDYGPLDYFKRRGQELAATTVAALRNMPIDPIEQCRGESSYAMRMRHPGYISHVNEGLGTKVRLADWLFAVHCDPSGYESVSEDTVAMIVNDLITLGSAPFSIQMHLAIGDENYLANEERSESLLRGWLKACLESEAVWTGGETPALKSIVSPDTSVMAGSADGWQPMHYPPVTPQIYPGASIILLESSGVHANGITLIRDLANRFESRKEELFRKTLVPTRNYVKAIKALVEKAAYPQSFINITGHGWRKLMRAKKELTYVIEKMPPRHYIFDAIQSLGNLTDEQLFGGYNVGAGFAVITHSCDAERTQKRLSDAGYPNLLAGYVEEGPKRVIIKPVNVTFNANSMNLRA